MGWLFRKKTAKVHPERSSKLKNWETLRGKKARENLEKELKREDDRDAATRKSKREGKGGRRRRTARR